MQLRICEFSVQRAAVPVYTSGAYQQFTVLAAVIAVTAKVAVGWRRRYVVLYRVFV